ncbi:hypothetical protein T02_11573 [Trichinella nativa]|uniref:Uncharacterized protein n=1 Tax=Trichinella nativa TaxID=6335 RepID=A0A0V1LFS6_9BILA|nr:hypothetical protein T02_11573 [Trichinella nativa]
MISSTRPSLVIGRTRQVENAHVAFDPKYYRRLESDLQAFPVQSSGPQANGSAVDESQTAVVCVKREIHAMIDHGLLIPLLLLLVIGLFILLFMLIRRLKWLQSLKFSQIPFITSVYQRLVLRKYQTLQEDDCQSTAAYNTTTTTTESNQMGIDVGRFYLT